jgi:hypothetical protein
VGDEVVTGSEYRWDNVLDVRTDYPQSCWDLANKVAKHSWCPDIAYTCDVCLVDDEPKIVELNSFSSAGLYACDLEKTIDRINKIALKEYKLY